MSPLPPKWTYLDRSSLLRREEVSGLQQPAEAQVEVSLRRADVFLGVVSPDDTLLGIAPSGIEGGGTRPELAFSCRWAEASSARRSNPPASIAAAVLDLPAPAAPRKSRAPPSDSHRLSRGTVKRPRRRGRDERKHREYERRSRLRLTDRPDRCFRARSRQDLDAILHIATPTDDQRLIFLSPPLIRLCRNGPPAGSPGDCRDVVLLTRKSWRSMGDENRLTRIPTPPTSCGRWMGTLPCRDAPAVGATESGPAPGFFSPS